VSGGFRGRGSLAGSNVADVARSFPRQERARFVDRLRLSHPLDRLVPGHEINVVKVGQQSFQKPQKGVEVLGAGEEPVGVEVDPERRPIGAVKPAKVVPEVGEGVSETTSFRLSCAVTGIYHGTRPSRPAL